jgi:penicillin-binding protein 1A
MRVLLQAFRRELTAARARYPLGVPLVAIAFLLFALLPMALGTWGILTMFTGLPDETAIGRMGEMDQATAVYDASDRLVFTIYKERRMEVPLEKVSPNLIQAMLAIEDQRFYQHRGFDLVRIASAVLVNVRRGYRAQGGSTITQQLARQSFLTPDKTVRRKIQELVLAARIERKYTKAEILQLYLNKVYFGDGLYGVEAAAQGFFGKHAADLSVDEAALLAGLVKSPSSYAPTVSVQRAIARRNVVLQVMHDNGTIDSATFERAKQTTINLQDGLRIDEPTGQYFKEQVRRELVERFGWEAVYQGGLKVYSTIDMAMQEAAESAVGEQLKRLDARRAKLPGAAPKGASDQPAADADLLQAALMAMDPHTGEVRAMVGGRDFDRSKFNRAVQAKRQPGSAFKPFVYAAALEAGFTPASIVDRLSEPIDTIEGAWVPEEEHDTGESISLRAGLRTSSNRAAVRLLQDVGIGKTVRYAKAMGVGNVPAVFSLALGSGEVTLESMTAAYSAFANAGQVAKPFVIRRVEDRSGQVLFLGQPQVTQAVSEQTAFLMASMLSDVINAGTAARARGLGFSLPAAGKTGTTNDFNDAWFVGFTPKLVTGVWVGFDAPKTIMPRGFASDVAVPLWTAFMKAATAGDKAEWLKTPSDITTATVCRMSGRLAVEGCEHAEVLSEDGHVTRRSMVYTEYFRAGTQPTASCDLHQSRTLPSHEVASVPAEGEKHEPPPVVAVVPPPPPPVAPRPSPVDVAAAAPAPTAEPEPAPKRRGFWGRVFGRRDRPDRDDDAGDRDRGQRRDRNDDRTRTRDQRR